MPGAMPISRSCSTIYSTVRYSPGEAGARPSYSSEEITSMCDIKDSSVIPDSAISGDIEPPQPDRITRATIMGKKAERFIKENFVRITELNISTFRERINTQICADELSHLDVRRLTEPV